MEEVGSSPSDQRVAACPAADGVRTFGPEEAIASARAHDLRGMRGSREDEHDGECGDEAHAQAETIDVRRSGWAGRTITIPRVSRLSQAIAEGDGISILVEVADAEAAGAAQSQGADVLVVRRDADAVRQASSLPLLHTGGTGDANPTVVDAVVVSPDVASWEAGRALALECVVRVERADEVERALEQLDPEVFLLAADPDADEDPLELLLALLHDVPAGKLAIAELHDATVDDVAELERAGVDGVLVSSGNVAALVGAEPPDV